MKTKKPKGKVRGMTLLEVLIVIMVLMILGAMYFSSLPRTHQCSLGFTCLNNLKQVGLAFRIWEGDYRDQYPMSVSVTNGGTMELIESGTVWQHFQVMSNELNTPKILICPNDAEREKNMALVFGGPPLTPRDPIAFTGNTNTSYFIGVDAVDTNPTMFLAGDRNLAVENVALKPGLHSLGTNELVGWTRELHVNQGNVLMADASVRQFSTAGLQKALENTGATTNSLAVP